MIKMISQKAGRGVGPSLCLLLVVAIGLPGCSGVRRALGIERTAPDEFAVLRQAPLVVPPEFRLRPPEAGATGPSVIEPRGQAARAVFGEAALGGNELLTLAERAFLGEANTDLADPDIVAVLEFETSGRVVNSALTDRIIDAPAEAERLRRNREAGRNVDDGETPTIEREGSDDGGFLPDIF